MPSGHAEGLTNRHLYGILISLSNINSDIIMGLAEAASKINWVDLVVLIFFLHISYSGFKAGFSNEVAPLLGVFATLLISLHNYTAIGQLLQTITPLSPAISSLAGFLILAIILNITFFIIKIILMRTVKVEVISIIERMGGLFLGSLRAALTISLILAILVLVPVGYIDKSIKDRSLIGTKFLKIGPALYDKVTRIFPGISPGGEPMSPRFIAPRWREVPNQTSSN